MLTRRWGQILKVSIFIVIVSVIGFLFFSSEKQEDAPKSQGDGPYLEGLADQYFTDFEGLNVPTVTGKTLEDHVLIAENETFALYLLEERLSIILESKDNGALFRSTVSEVDLDLTEAWRTFIQSGVVVEYIKNTNLVPERVDLIRGAPRVAYRYQTDGFNVRVFYEELVLGYELIVRLTDQGLEVQLPESSLVEASDANKFGNIYVFPFLGHSKPGLNQGYMLIPDGSGALIYLEDNNRAFRQPYSEKVFGRNIGIDDPYVVSLFAGRFDPINPNFSIKAPIYGMVHTDSEIAMLAMIEGGMASATIQAYPNGAVTPYDWISSFFVYRQVYNQLTSQTTGTMPVRQNKRNSFDIHVRYHFLTGEDANYVGMAKHYRDELIDSGRLLPKEMAFDMRLDFLGLEEENWLMFKRPVTMTTANQVGAILTSLHEKGLEHITAILRGWQQYGISGGLPVNRYQPASAVGGASELQVLLEQTDALGHTLLLDMDPMTINKDRVSFAEQRAVKKLNKRTHNEIAYKLVYRDFYYQLPSRTKSELEKHLESFGDAGYAGLHVRTLTNELFSYLHQQVIQDRQDTLDTHTEIFNMLNDRYALHLNDPIQPYWQYAKAITDFKVESSKYIFIDEEVPFFAIVMNGVMPVYSDYNNFMANQERYKLQLIEQGVLPSFLLTQEDPSLLMHTNSNAIYSSKFEFYEDVIVAYYEELKAVYKTHAGALVTDYERQGKVSITTYDNGVTIYVNFGEGEQMVDGISIAGMSYKVGE